MDRASEVCGLPAVETRMYVCESLFLHVFMVPCHARPHTHARRTSYAHPSARHNTHHDSHRLAPSFDGSVRAAPTQHNQRLPTGNPRLSCGSSALLRSLNAKLAWHSPCSRPFALIGSA